LIFSWERDFDVEDRRTDVLRALRQRDQLRGWRRAPDLAGALLSESREMVLLESSGHITESDGRLNEQAWGALALALSTLKPTLVGVTVAHQYCMPVPQDYDAARTTGGDRLLGTNFSRTGGNDFAILQDGEYDGAPYQIEYGVVNRGEAQLRLQRRVGRSHAPPPLLAPDQSQDLADVAFFADVSWRMTADDDTCDDGMFQDYQTFAERVAVAGGGLLSELTSGWLLADGSASDLDDEGGHNEFHDAAPGA